MSNPTYTKLKEGIAPVRENVGLLISPQYGTYIVFEQYDGYFNKWKGTVIESFKSKKYSYIQAKTSEDIEAHFVKLVEREEYMASRRIEHQADRKKAKDSFLSKLEVDTILHGSWGYEQTNCEFYIIREINKNRVKIQKLRHKHASSTGNSMAENVIPDLKGAYGELEEKIVAGNGIKLHSSCTLHIWSGKPCYSSWYA